MIGYVSAEEQANKDRDPFIGTWKLVSLELRSEDGKVSYPFGQDASGYIFYSADGYMSGAIMRAGRRKFVSADIRGGTTEEKTAAADTYVSYCGRY